MLLVVLLVEITTYSTYYLQYTRTHTHHVFCCCCVRNNLQIDTTHKTLVAIYKTQQTLIEHRCVCKESCISADFPNNPLLFCLFSSAGRPSQYHTHYQHYFSYFYNRGGAEKQLLSKSSFANSGRKLPMSKFQKPNAIAASRREDDADERNWSSPKYEKHVLKEKLPSNDLDTDYLEDNNGWGEAEDDGDNYRETKDTYDTTVLVDGFEQIHRRYCRISENTAIEDVGDSILNNNNNNELKFVRKSDQPAPRLPMTPKRAKGGATTVPVKKPLPTVHRVLLYSTQSPRMGRKQQLTSQRSLSQKQQQQSAKSLGGGGGGGDAGQTVILVEPESKPDAGRRSPIDEDFDDDDDLDNRKKEL